DLLIRLTGWVRARLRAALWRQWKTSRRRRAMLLQLGVHGRLAADTAVSGRGPWHLAHSQAVCFALSNAFFRDRGLPSLFGQRKANVSNRRVRTRTHGGVAGIGGRPPPLCRSMWRVLETALRKLLTGHEGGNAGYRQGVSYEFVAPALDPTR